MSLDFSGLTDLAKSKKTVQGWQPLTLGDLGTGSVLAFDQSLTASGFVAVECSGTEVRVTRAGMLGTVDGPQGVETDLQRGVHVYLGAQDLIVAVKGDHSVIHESPPHPGKVKGGGTSSLMSAQAVRCAAASLYAEIEMLGAQPAKRLICGNAAAPKPEAHAALKLHCFPWITGSELVTNEATRDALMIALLWLHRRK